MSELVVVDHDPPQPECTALIEVFERRLALPPRSIEEAVAWHQDAWKLRERIRIEKLSLDLTNRATAIWLARCRQIGALLAVMPKQSGARTAGFLRETPTLKDLGLRKKQSHQFQRLALIPREDFEGWVWDRLDRRLQLTLKEGLYIARAYCERPTQPRRTRYSPFESVTIAVDLVWDIADAATEAVQAGPDHPQWSAVLLDSLDLIMDRIADIIPVRDEWQRVRKQVAHPG